MDAEDLVQGTAAVYLAREAPLVDAAPWLERVLRNRAVDTWRRHQREMPPSVALPEVAVDRSPLEELEAQEERQLLARACAALGPGERALLARRFDQAGVVGFSSSERTRLRRLLLRLRRELGHLRAVILSPGFLSLGAQGTAALVVVTPVLMAASLGLWAPVRAPSDSAEGAGPRRLVEVHDLASGEREQALAQQGPAASRATVAVALAAGPERSVGQPRLGVRASARPRASREPSPSASETRFDFDEDEVEGELQAPDEILVDGRRPTKNPSLIELRRDFVPELVKELEDMD